MKHLKPYIPSITSLTDAKINETLRIKQHNYEQIKTNEGRIFIGEDGILGNDKTFIDWNTIIQYYDKLRATKNNDTI